MNCVSMHSCVCCGTRNLRTALNLGYSPPANAYLHNPDEQENVFPLSLNLCEECGHLQLGHCVDPGLLFRNYMYRTGVGSTIHEYCNWFAKWSTNMHGHSPKTVLDIACNDGSQLDAFKNEGMSTFGVDPAVNLATISSKSHSVIADFCTEDTLSEFDVAEFDILVAQNVMAHTCDPQTIMVAAKSKMGRHSLFFVQTSQADMLMHGQFDTIYHEHISFFSIDSMRKLAARSGLTMVAHSRVAIHGGSHIFVFMREDCAVKMGDIPNSETRGIEIIDTFRENVRMVKHQFQKRIDKAREDGIILVGYGAAAKGINFLNYCDVRLDFIVDETPSKQGLFTPKMHIQVVHPEFVRSLDINIISWVILTWNYRDEVSKKIAALCGTDEFDRIELGIESM